MTANTQTKAVPKWKLWARRQVKPRPYWQQRLEERLERKENLFWAFWAGIGQIVTGVFGMYIGAISVALFGTLFIQFFVLPIFFSPGFFEYGLADPLGHLFAAICLQAGYCDLRYLMAAFGLGLPVVIAMVVFPLRIGLAAVGSPEEDEPDNSEVIEAVSELDARITRLRGDLVVGGVLKISPEEREEQEAYEADLAERAQRGYPFDRMLVLSWVTSFAYELFIGRVILPALGLGWLAMEPIPMLVAMVGTVVLTFALAFYDAKRRKLLATVEASPAAPALPAATYTPGLHPWPNPEEALIDMVKGERAASAREANERLIQKQAEQDASAARAYLTSPLPASAPDLPAAYVRPELTKEHQAAAGKYAVELTSNKSTMQLRAAVAMVLLENQRLALEVNDHRTARGLEPLPTFKVGK